MDNILLALTLIAFLAAAVFAVMTIYCVIKGNPKDKNLKRLAASVVVMVACFGGLMMVVDTPQENKPAVKQELTEDQKQEKAKEKIQEAVKKSYEEAGTAVGKIEKVDVFPFEGGYNVTVWTQTKGAIRKSSTIFLFEQGAKKAFAGAYQSGENVNKVTVITRMELTNTATGQTSLDKVYQITLDKKAAAKMNWKNIDIVDINILGTDKWISPVIH